MNQGTLKEIEALAARTGHALLATAGKDCTPHIAVAGSLSVGPGGSLVIREWLCPGTVENLGVNRRAVLAVWDPAADEGYQVGGTVESIEEIAMMNGYAPGEEREPVPQAEMRLTLKPHIVTRFGKRPHSDLEE